MSKWLKFGINTVVFFSYIGIAIGYLVFLFPIGYLFEAFQNSTAHAILSSDNFLRLANNHQATLAAVNSFPSWPYALLMSVGLILMAWAGIKSLTALIRLLNNIVAQEYFSASNEKALRTIFKMQLVTFVSDLFFASGNQLTRSWLLRVNHGMSPETWSDCIQDIYVIIFLAAIYETYRHAMRMKTENDLTV